MTNVNLIYWDNILKEVGEEIKKAVDYIVPEEFEENASNKTNSQSKFKDFYESNTYNS